MSKWGNCRWKVDGDYDIHCLLLIALPQRFCNTLQGAHFQRETQRDLYLCYSGQNLAQQFTLPFIQTGLSLALKEKAIDYKEREYYLQKGSHNAGHFYRLLQNTHSVHNDLCLVTFCICKVKQICDRMYCVWGEEEPWRLLCSLTANNTHTNTTRETVREASCWAHLPLIALKLTFLANTQLPAGPVCTCARVHMLDKALILLVRGTWGACLRQRVN